jgi:hypothetical protein
MSKNNNVNPGQYKVAGRERPGEDVVAAEHKARLTQAQPSPKAATSRKTATSKTAKKSVR